jgi:oligo-1,6-glucosidase
MAYHFEGMDVGNFDPNYSLLDFKRVYTKWDSAFEEKGWVSIFLGNHDQPRMLSHWGSDDPRYREAASKMLTTFLLTMRGTPYCYYGDELGMSNIRFDRISDYRDIATINKFKHISQTGGDTTAFIEEQKRSARDNGRTPFQWDDSPNAGFTTGTPWLKVNPDYLKVNAAAQEKDEFSVLSYFRKAVQLRKSNPALVYGRYTILDRENPGVYAYIREDGQKKFLVLLNFKSAPGSFVLPSDIDLTRTKVVLSNYPEAGGAGRGAESANGGAAGAAQSANGGQPATGGVQSASGTQPLRPYEAVVYELVQ